MKYSFVCVGPYIKDIRRKYTKKCNNSEDNNEEATTNEKVTIKKKDVLRNLYCTNCDFITKFNPYLAFMECFYITLMSIISR